MKPFVKKKILGVGFSDVSETEVLEYLVKEVQKKDKKFYIVTPNPEILVLADGDKRYKNLLNQAELALPDGVGIMWASKVLEISLKGKIAGIDLLESVCREVSKRPITVGFLGGRPKIAERVAECLKKRYFGLKIAFFGPEIANFKTFPKCDILFVAFGSPKQEFWIQKNLKRLPVTVAIGVGGAFDMVSGEVGRAPKFVRDLGLEWLYRLIRQPWRAKRQLSLVKFVFLVLKEKFGL